MLNCSGSVGAVTVCGGSGRQSAAHLLRSLALLRLVDLVEAEEGSSEGVGPGQFGHSGGEHDGGGVLAAALRRATSELL